MTTAIKINANDGVQRNVMAGGETEVDFDFPIYDATHIQIFETNAAGAITLLVKDTDYTVPSGSVNQQAGGVCTLDTGVYPSGATAGHVFTAYQAAPAERTTDFNQAGDFFANALNRELDLFAQQTQQIRRDLNRSLLAPVDTTITSFYLPAPEDGKSLIWDGLSGRLINGPNSGEITAAQGFATAAESSKDDAAAILAQVETLYDNFDDRYLGTKSADPTLDNDGNTLIDGALVFNTTDNVMKVYDLATTTWLVIDTVIADNSITQAKMANNSIGTSEIINEAVTQEKIDSTVNILGSIGGGTQDIDLDSGRSVTGTVDTGTTTFSFSNPKATGNADGFYLILTNGGSQTVNWPASVNWIGATSPALTTSGVDHLVFTTVDAGTTWSGFMVGADVK